MTRGILKPRKNGSKLEKPLGLAQRFFYFIDKYIMYVIIFKNENHSQFLGGDGLKREYNTEQKRKITEFLKNNANRHWTASEIANAVCDEGLGKSTAYRIISKLFESGVLRRFETASTKSFVYQYVGLNDDCDSHFHLKCAKCGRLLHMHCPELEHVKKHIIDDHNFIIGSKRAVIYGECTDCAIGNEASK